MAKVDVNIAVSDPARFAPVLAEAREIGLAVSQSLEELGVASGSIDSADLPRLQRIPGITVEPNRSVSIPDRPGPRR